MPKKSQKNLARSQNLRKANLTKFGAQYEHEENPKPVKTLVL